MEYFHQDSAVCFHLTFRASYTLSRAIPLQSPYRERGIMSSKLAAVTFGCLPRAVLCGGFWHCEGSFQSFFPQPQSKERKAAGWPSLLPFLVKQSWGEMGIQGGKWRLPMFFASSPQNSILSYPLGKASWGTKKPRAKKWESPKGV